MEKTGKKDEDADEDFEASMARLDAVVGRLESVDLPLGEMVSLYEEGMTLVKRCGDRLDEAEMRIMVISGKDGAVEKEKKDVTKDACS